MEIENSNKYGKLDINRLLKFEKYINSRLPEDYRQYLIKYNGGKPLPCDFKISEEEGVDSLHHFYGLHDGPTYSSLEESQKVYKGRMPNSMIAFCDDPSGNAICIGVSGDDFGKIFFWDHELEGDEEEQQYYGNVTLIANTFNDFINSLFEYINPDESEIKKIIRTNDLTALNKLLDSGYDIETKDNYDRTIIENSAIAANNEMIQLLFDRGAKIRNALILAEQNANYFDKHKITVSLLKELKNKV